MSHPQEQERIIDHSLFETIRHYAEYPDKFTKQEMSRIQNQIDNIIAYQDATICGSGIQILKQDGDDIEIVDAEDLILSRDYDWYNGRFYPKLHNVVVVSVKKENDIVIYEGKYFDDHNTQIHDFIAPVKTSEIRFNDDFDIDFNKELDSAIENINCKKTRRTSKKIYELCQRERQEQNDQFGFMNLTKHITYLNPYKIGDTQAYLEYSCYAAFFQCNKLVLESRQVDYKERNGWRPSLIDNGESITVSGAPIAVFFESIQPISSKKVFIPYVFIEEDQGKILRIPFQQISNMEMIYE